MKLKPIYLLLLIFAFAFLFRLFFVFQTDFFSDDLSYNTIRNVNYIKQNFSPMLYDTLSFGGREVFFPPLFYYILLFFSFIPLYLKIVPALFSASLVFIAYLFSLKITDDRSSAFFASLLASFVPVLYIMTLNKVSFFSLMLPLIFLMLYSFLNLSDKAYLKIFLLLSLLLPLIHPSAIIISISLIFYSLVVYVEPLKLSKRRREAILFSAFLIFFVEFVIYKKVFLDLGFNIIWGNVPSQILASHFASFNIIDMIYSIGILPSVFGIFGIVFGIFRDRKHSAILLSSLILSSLALLSFKLIDFSLGLLFTGVSLAIISSISFSKFFRYFRLTKFARFESHAKFTLFFLIILTSLIPSYFVSSDIISETLSEDEFQVLSSLSQEADYPARILSSPDEGNYITAIANRQSVIDSNFVYVGNIDSLYSDVEEIYRTPSGSEALKLLNKYNINYIYLSPRTKAFYNIERLSYENDENCFRKVKDVGEVKAYKVRC